MTLVKGRVFTFWLLIIVVGCILYSMRRVSKGKEVSIRVFVKRNFFTGRKSFVARRTNRNTGRKMRPVVVFRVSNMNPSTHLENEVVAGRKRL